MAQDIILSRPFLIVLTGILPPILWLWFWLKEDPHPESRKTLIISFFSGMAIVPVALMLEYVWYKTATTFGLATENQFSSLFLLFGWAFIEEGAKLWTAWQVDLKRSVYDEPVDALIFLITVALGFSALENVLFMLDLASSGPVQSAITANMRFFGATLLHTVTAGIMGISIAFSFFHKERIHRNVFGGLILATILHGFFNAFIINAGNAETIFKTFFVIWTLAIILIFFFEKIKRIHY